MIISLNPSAPDFGKIPAIDYLPQVFIKYGFSIRFYFSFEIWKNWQFSWRVAISVTLRLRVVHFVAVDSEKAPDRLIKWGMKYFSNYSVCLATRWIPPSCLVYTNKQTGNLQRTLIFTWFYQQCSEKKFPGLYFITTDFFFSMVCECISVRKEEFNRWLIQKINNKVVCQLLLSFMPG